MLGDLSNTYKNRVDCVTIISSRREVYWSMKYIDFCGTGEFSDWTFQRSRWWYIWRRSSSLFSWGWSENSVRRNRARCSRWNQNSGAAVSFANQNGRFCGRNWRHVLESQGGWITDVWRKRTVLCCARILEDSYDRNRGSCCCYSDLFASRTRSCSLWDCYWCCCSSTETCCSNSSSSCWRFWGNNSCYFAWRCLDLDSRSCLVWWGRFVKCRSRSNQLDRRLRNAVTPPARTWRDRLPDGCLQIGSSPCRQALRRSEWLFDPAAASDHYLHRKLADCELPKKTRGLDFVFECIRKPLRYYCPWYRRRWLY